MLRRLCLFLVDFIIFLLAGIISLFIRFGWDFDSIIQFFPAVLIASLMGVIAFFLFGIYKVVWAYMSNNEVVLIFKATIVAYFMNLLIDLIFPTVMPRSVGIMQFLGAALVVLLSRIWWSWYVHEGERKGDKGQMKTRVGIVGAGEAGILLLEDLKKGKLDKNVVLFIDDSKRKIGRKVRGIEVSGPISDIDQIISEKKLEEIVVAIPSADSSLMKRITSKIDLKKVKMKVLPSISEIMDNKIAADQIREVAIEDLLGREPVRLDLSEIEEANRNKVILVTGAGGSIGSEITRQLIAMRPKRIIAFGRGENSIYHATSKFLPLLKEYQVEYTRIIGDITDRQRLISVFEEFSPQVVYHCAAHKHVPLMEENPSEAFRVNSLGTKTLVDVCLAYATQRFTLISTDKAVNPTSIMGLSKRLAEMYIRAMAKIGTKTTFSVVRFGNVLGSRGSVIPKFKEQIKNGGPVTVTDKNMRRFFMTIPEASSLVLQASSFMNNGDLFILDMGEQIYIKDLVENMILLAGLIPGQDIEIEYTGIRPGEKLYEELFLDMEKALSTKHPKIFRVIENEKYTADEMALLMEKLYRFSVEREQMQLKRLIDEYIPDHQIQFEGGNFNAAKPKGVFEASKS